MEHGDADRRRSWCAVTMAKRIVALILGILFGVLGLHAFTTLWEPHSAVVRAHRFGSASFFLCVLLMWYGSRRRDSSGGGAGRGGRAPGGTR